MKKQSQARFDFLRARFDGMGYEEREWQKTEAWRRFTRAETIADPEARRDEQEAAVWMVIRAHYDRSREHYPGEHPPLDIYARHWFAAMARKGYVWAKSAFLLQMQQQYRLLPGEFPMIEYGHTYWPDPPARDQRMPFNVRVGWPLHDQPTFRLRSGRPRRSPRPAKRPSMRRCAVCGAEFYRARGSMARTCSKSCGGRLSWRNRVER